MQGSCYSLAMTEIQPVAVVGGIEYYFGTPENPYNYFPNIGVSVDDKRQMRSQERERLHLLGDTIKIVEIQDESYPDHQPYIKAANIALRQAQLENKALDIAA